jgi:glutaminyl-tRNA synthetase
MGVLDPLKITIVNFPEGERIDFDAPFNPEQPEGPSRKVPLTRTVYIERDDFMENPPKKFFRLAPGAEVRLRYACIIKCVDVKKDAAGKVTELLCEWDPTSRGGSPADGRKIKGTVHWVSAEHAVNAEVRLYDRLWRVENPMESKDDWLSHKNPDSMNVRTACKVEPSLAHATAGERFQFERLGYFCVDKDSGPDKLVFNRTITLKDTWAAVAEKS